jgi:hypothetical protein
MIPVYDLYLNIEGLNCYKLQKYESIDMLIEQLTTLAANTRIISILVLNRNKSRHKWIMFDLMKKE